MYKKKKSPCFAECGEFIAIDADYSPDMVIRDIFIIPVLPLFEMMVTNSSYDVGHRSISSQNLSFNENSSRLPFVKK